MKSELITNAKRDPEIYTPTRLETFDAARRLKTVLDMMKNGMDTFEIVFEAFKKRHGKQLHEDFIREVHK